MKENGTDTPCNFDGDDVISFLQLDKVIISKSEVKQMSFWASKYRVVQKVHFRCQNS